MQNVAETFRFPLNNGNIMKKFIRKNNRLDITNYASTSIYFVTICTYEKQRIFCQRGIVDSLVAALKEVSFRKQFAVLAYCFMPDHLHLLLSNNGGASLIDYIKLYKQKTGHYYKKLFNNKLWQKSFYDHILRKEESVSDVVLYIFANPIRKKLVDDFLNYPYLGSFTFDLNEAFCGNLKVSSTNYSIEGFKRSGNL